MKLENLTRAHRQELEAMASQLQAISDRLYDMSKCYQGTENIHNHIRMMGCYAWTAAEQLKELLPRPEGLTYEEWELVQSLREERATGIVDMRLWADGNSTFQR